MFENYPDIVSVEQVMEMLHLGKSTVYGLIRNGNIPTTRLRRKYLISKICIIDFLTHDNYTSSQLISSELRLKTKGEDE